MGQTSRTIRTIQYAFLFSILLYGVVGEIIRSHSGYLNPAFSYVLTAVAMGVVGMIFVVRRTWVLPAAQSLRSRPDNPVSLNHWKTGYLVTYSLCEALAIFGFLLRLLGFGMQQSVTFYFCGFILLAFFSPKRDHVLT
ncbi:MAG TPA: hypothetical protein VFO39_17135 [Candidatus Sulfotelmatobacter sp.]|nr:hypothetical protein [Candidatus Sulfotelmatobacter sp.]